MNSVVCYNTGGNFLSNSLSYCCTTPDPGGTGNITNHPGFVCRDAGNYHLLASSVCMDAGNNEYAAGEVDLDGRPRILGGAVDMGAYESRPNLLSNPEFEIGSGASIASWNAWGGAGLEPWAARTGTNGLAMYGWTGGGGVYQDVSASGVSNYTFTVYGFEDTNFSPYLTVEMKIEFIDGTGGMIWAMTNTVEGSDTWDIFSVSAQSPGNTVVVRVVLAFGGSAGTGGAFKWDDAELVSSVPVRDMHHVSVSGSHMFPYTNWAMAAHDIQSAIDASFSGDMVLVTDGTYAVSSEICIARGITLQSVNGSSNTILDGCHTTRCFRLAHANAVVDGFTIRNGCAEESYGGGVYMSGEATLRNCIITGNSASDSGGGTYCNGDAMIQNCSISGNTAGDESSINAYGGGVYLKSGGTLRDCSISGNSVIGGFRGSWWPDGEGYGGGIYCKDAGTVQNCTISGNSIRGGCAGGGYFGGSVWGGGIYGNGAIVQDCVICDNSATKGAGPLYGGNDESTGGGILCCDTSPVIRNCTIADNQTSSDAGGISCVGAAGPRIVNCILWGNDLPQIHGTPSTTCFCCVEGGFSGDGNITNAPQFKDADDYHLTSGSPCIDTGMSIDAPDTDLNGVPRPLDGDTNGVAGFDMGAYEFIHTNADTDVDGLNDVHELQDYGTDPTNSDTEGDGQRDGDEVVAGMDPNEPSSVFVATVEGPLSTPEQCVISWSSASNRNYVLERGTNMLVGTYSVLESNIVSSPPENTYTDWISGEWETYYYRVKVQMEE